MTRAEDGYAAATGNAAVADRSDRRRWTVTGRDPAGMLNGIVTNTIPPPLEETIPGLRRGHAPYGLTLTPKGKIVSDHRLVRLGGGEENAFLLDVPAAGADALLDHFGRYLPPRMARVTDRSAETAMITVLGPESAARIAGALPGWRDAEDLLDDLEVGEALVSEAGEVVGEGADEGAEEDRGDAPAEAAAVLFRVIRSGDSGFPELGAPPAFDLVGSRTAVAQIHDRLRAAGCPTLDSETLEILRVEGGAPAFGVDLDDSTIPVEAGIDDRAIDHAKGCYTGQEVIVRIRDRGHVNRHLRGLRLEGGEIPGRGTVLHSPEMGRDVGEVTSAVRSPAFGGVVGLGYVRREVEPGSTVRLGDGEGPEVRVLALEPADWR